MKVKVLTPFSEIKEIEVDGISEIELLTQQGYTILETKRALPKLKFQIFKLSPSFLASFFRDLSGFLSVGVPLTQAIEELEKTTTNRTEKNILKEIKQRMEQGFFLYQIFSDLNFPQEVVVSVKIGEKAGVLQKTFEHLAWYYEQIVAFQGKLKTAFIYPSFVLILTFAVATAISVFVVPKIREFLISIPDLPSITKIFLSLTSFLSRMWWAFPVSIVAVFLVIKWIFTSQKGVRIVATIWNTKMFAMFKERIFANFFLELYLLLENGLSLGEALNIIDLSNKLFNQIVEKIKAKLDAGFSFSQALSDEKVFPAFVVQTIAKGETAGLLTDYVKNVSDFFWKRLDSYQKVIENLAGHVLLVVIGIGVGAFVGIFLFSIYSALPQLTKITTIGR
jgi:type II secretory pathway component PulF